MKEEFLEWSLSRYGSSLSLSHTHTHTHTCAQAHIESLGSSACRDYVIMLPHPLITPEGLLSFLNSFLI